MADCKACGAWFSSTAKTEICPTCERALKRLNGYAVPVVHGHWDGYECSICDGNYMDYADADSYPAIGEPKPNYCPNCGARMDGDGDG